MKTSCSAVSTLLDALAKCGLHRLLEETTHNHSTQDVNAASSSKQCAPSICSLPDEVLQEIFKKLSYNDLVNVACHVCTRWRDLVSDRSMWTSAQVKGTDIGGGMALEKILSAAPALHTLDLSRILVTKSTFETILSKKIQIRNLIISDCLTEPSSHDLLIPVLRHLSGDLEALSLQLQDSYFRSGEVQHILGDMRKLRSLTLVGSLNLHQNIERLKPSCPLLERLDISRFETRSNKVTTSFNFSSELVTKYKESLKEINLSQINEPLRISVIECPFLTTVSLQSEYLELVSHLHLIETLTIECNGNISTRPPRAWTRPNALKELILILKDPSDNCISFLRNIEKPPALTLISDRLCREMEAYLSADVKRLTLRCRDLRLRHLTVTILRKMALPNLVYLDVRKCFLGMGIPPKILSELRRVFPSISVRSDKFYGYRKVREKRYDVVCSIEDTTDCSDTDDP